LTHKAKEFKSNVCLRVFRNSDSDKHKVMKLLSLACLSDRHEYCSLSFASATDCKCNCHPGRLMIDIDTDMRLLGDDLPTEEKIYE
jgi:hypothetical protein